MDIVDSLRQEIVLWELPPGTHLSELALAERFGVSRTPIRQAIKQLVMEDLVRFYPGRGAFVSEISVPDLVELFQMREALEPASAQLAAEAVRTGKPAKVLAEIVDEIVRSAESLRTGERGQYFKATESLDRVLAELAGNRRLMAALSRVWAEVARAKRLIFSNDERLLISVDEHLEILHSVMDGDSDRARDVTARHVRSAREAVISIASAPMHSTFSTLGRG